MNIENTHTPTIQKENVLSPPTKCWRCGNKFLECAPFMRDREWEINCFRCGNLWWTHRKKSREHADNDNSITETPAFAKYRFPETDTDPT